MHDNGRRLSDSGDLNLFEQHIRSFAINNIALFQFQTETYLIQSIKLKLLQKFILEHKNYSHFNWTAALLELLKTPLGLVAVHWYWQAASLAFKVCIVKPSVDTDPPEYFPSFMIMFSGALLMYLIHCILLTSGPVTVQPIVILPPCRPVTLTPVATVKLPEIQLKQLHF